MRVGATLGSRPRPSLVILTRLAFLVLIASFFLIPSLCQFPPNLMYVQSRNLAVASTLLTSTSGFNLSASPSSLSLRAGSSKTVQITVTSLGGFSGTVYLSASAIDDRLVTSLNMSVVQISSGGTRSTTVTVTAPIDLPPGSDYVAIEGDGGCTLSSFTHISVSVTGPDFTISADRTKMTISPGSSDTATITLASENGFAGTVSLSDSSPLLPSSLTPPSITLSNGATGSSTLMVSVPHATNPSGYQISVVGGYGSQLFHQITILVTVPGSTFSLSANPQNLTLVPGGASNSSSITAIPFERFTGTISLVNSTRPGGLIVTLDPNTLTIPAAVTARLSVSAPLGTAPQTFFVDVSGTSTTSGGAMSQAVELLVIVKASDFQLSSNPRHFTVLAGGKACTSTITATGLEGFSGTVDLAQKSIPHGLHVSLYPQSVSVPSSPTSSLTVSAPSGIASGSYVVVINGTGVSTLRTHQTNLFVQVIGPDFTIAATPASAVADGSTSATSIVTISPLYGFGGTVTLTEGSIPNRLNCQALSRTTISGSGMSALSCTSTFAGYYLVTIMAANDSLQHAATATFTFTATSAADFTIGATTPVSFTSGSTATSTVTLTAKSGFSSQVVLSATVSPTTGLSVFLNPQNFPYGSGTSTATFSSSTPGSYTITITGADGSLQHATTVQVTVASLTPPDITLSASSPSLSFNTGTSGTATITVASQNGFTGAVSLAVTTPTGVSCNLSSTTIQSSGTSTLTCNGSTAGDYTVTITANGGASAHTTNVTIHVNSISPIAPAPTTLFGMTPAVFYGMIGVIVVAVIAVATLLFRQSKRVKQ